MVTIRLFIHFYDSLRCKVYKYSIIFSLIARNKVSFLFSCGIFYLPYIVIFLASPYEVNDISVPI